MMIVGAACPAAGRDNIANDEAASDEAEAIDIATGDEGAVVEGIAGPSSTPGQLRTDSQDTQGAVSNETIDDALDRYFDYKERIAVPSGARSTPLDEHRAHGRIVLDLGQRITRIRHPRHFPVVLVLETLDDGLPV